MRTYFGGYRPFWLRNKLAEWFRRRCDHPDLGRCRGGRRRGFDAAGFHRSRVPRRRLRAGGRADVAWRRSQQPGVNRQHPQRQNRQPTSCPPLVRGQLGWRERCRGRHHERTHVSVNPGSLKSCLAAHRHPRTTVPPALYQEPFSKLISLTAIFTVVLHFNLGL